MQEEQILPDWFLMINKGANGEYHFKAIDLKGAEARVDTFDYNSGLTECKLKAFDAEKRSGRNLNKFFYETCLTLIPQNSIINKRYENATRGSWYIESDTARLVLDGKEEEIRVQRKVKKLFSVNWKTIDTIKHPEELSFTELENITKSV